MSYRDLHTSVQKTLAQSLQGEALHALVRQLVEDQDVAFLKLVQGAMRFIVKSDDLEAGQRNDRSSLNPRCLPMIDALGTLMCDPVYAAVEYTAPAHSRPPAVGSLEARLRVTPAMKTFVHDVVSETLACLRVVERSQTTSGPTQAIGATIAVMNALACAMNDVPLLRKIRDARIQENLHTGEFIDGRDLPEKIGPSPLFLSPIAVAVAYNAVDAVRELIEHSPEVMAQCHAQRDDGGVRRPVSILEITPSGGLPSPEMIELLLDAFRHEEGGYPDAVKTWVVETLLPNTFDSHWPHLIDLVFDRRLEGIAPEVVIELTATNAMPSILERMSGHMKFPALELGSTAPSWFEGHHPLCWAMDVTNQQNRAQRESTVAVVLSEMSRRGLQQDLFSARHASGHSVASTCVLMGWNTALVTLIDMGLDLEPKLKLYGCTRTLEAWATAEGATDAELILKSARARRAALETLTTFAAAGP